jgi:hypothetical protein
MATETPHRAMTDQNANSETQIDLPLLETTMRHCRWPIGDPRDRNPRVCGAPVARPGLPYCETHMLRGYGGSNEKVEIDKAPPSGLNKTARESLAHYYTRSTVRLGTWLDPLTVEFEETENDQEPEDDESNDQEEANNQHEPEPEPEPEEQSKPETRGRKKGTVKSNLEGKRLIWTAGGNIHRPGTRSFKAMEPLVAAGSRGMSFDDWRNTADPRHQTLYGNIINGAIKVEDE